MIRFSKNTQLFFGTDKQPLTADVALHAQRGRQDYQIKGPWFGGAELKGRRGSQEDRMFAMRLNKEEQSKYRALTRQDQEALLTAVTEELSVAILSNPNFNNQGSTGLIAILDPTEKTSFIINLGDSQAFAIKINQQNALLSATRLHPLHNPNEPAESTRLQKFPVQMGRLNGELAVSRAFGDKGYIRHGLSNQPELTWTQHELEAGETLYFVTACDGLTENGCLTPKEIGHNIIPDRQEPLENTALALANKAIQRGSNDNISVQITPLLVKNDNAIKILGIFDGHGGSDVAQYLKDNWARVFEKQLNNRFLSTPDRIKNFLLQYKYSLSAAVAVTAALYYFAFLPKLTLFTLNFMPMVCGIALYGLIYAIGELRSFGKQCFHNRLHQNMNGDIPAFNITSSFKAAFELGVRSADENKALLQACTSPKLWVYPTLVKAYYAGQAAQETHDEMLIARVRHERKRSCTIS